MAVQNLPFIENMEKRIQNATFLLDGSLRHCFVDALEHRDANAIYNCLRAYAAIDSTSAAEEIFRTTIVAPLIQKVIPYGQSLVANGASSDELEMDYKQIAQCIEKDCKFLLEISSSGFGSYPIALYSLLLKAFFCMPSYSALCCFVQPIQVYMFLIFWPIQYLKRSFLLFKRENQGRSLLEDLQNFWRTISLAWVSWHVLKVWPDRGPHYHYTCSNIPKFCVLKIFVASCFNGVIELDAYDCTFILLITIAECMLKRLYLIHIGQ